MDGTVESHGKVTVRADKKEFDIQIEKSGKKITVPGIYKLEEGGKLLTMAWSGRRDGAVRPANYVGAGDNDVRVVVVNRKKEK